MTTLIIAKQLDGTITGRCDARCHDATGATCKCICAGMNHGKGFTAAVRNTSFKADIRQSAHAAAEILFPHIQSSFLKGDQS